MPLSNNQCFVCVRDTGPLPTSTSLWKSGFKFPLSPFLSVLQPSLSAAGRQIPIQREGRELPHGSAVTASGKAVPSWWWVAWCLETLRSVCEGYLGRSKRPSASLGSGVRGI